MVTTPQKSDNVAFNRGIRCIRQMPTLLCRRRSGCLWMCNPYICRRAEDFTIQWNMCQWTFWLPFVRHTVALLGHAEVWNWLKLTACSSSSVAQLTSNNEIQISQEIIISCVHLPRCGHTRARSVREKKPSSRLQTFANWMHDGKWIQKKEKEKRKTTADGGKMKPKTWNYQVNERQQGEENKKNWKSSTKKESN